MTKVTILGKSDKGGARVTILSKSGKGGDLGLPALVSGPIYQPRITQIPPDSDSWDHKAGLLTGRNGFWEAKVVIPGLFLGSHFWTTLWTTFAIFLLSRLLTLGPLLSLLGSLLLLLSTFWTSSGPVLDYLLALPH